MNKNVVAFRVSGFKALKNDLIQALKYDSEMNIFENELNAENDVDLITANFEEYFGYFREPMQEPIEESNDPLLQGFREAFGVVPLEPFDEKKFEKAREAASPYAEDMIRFIREITNEDESVYVSKGVSLLVRDIYRVCKFFGNHTQGIALCMDLANEGKFKAEAEWAIEQMTTAPDAELEPKI